MPLRPCSKVGCSALTPGRFCVPHEEAHRAASNREDRERRGDARTDRGYDWRWRKYREAYLDKHPLCVECAAGIALPGGRRPVAVTAATVVDHIRAHKGDQALFWSPENHRAVCKPHHDARVDEGDFGRVAR